METGLIYDMPEQEYFALDAASNSTLSRMKQSPAHCRAYLDGDKEETPAMRLGSLVHTLVLEPEKYPLRYAIAPQVNRRTKEGKAEYAAFLEDAEGKTIITSDELHQATAMAGSVLNHPIASALIDGKGQAEVSAYWRSEEHDICCKCRFDYISTKGYLVDLKTTNDASTDEFSRSIAKFGYHRQNAMYMDGYKESTGADAKGFVFIAVEKKPPYAVNVFMLDGDSVSQGRDEYRELLNEYARCKRSGEWPAYDPQVKQISLPAWARK